MTKQEFLKKHDLTEQDYKNLIRYEELRQSGVMNMFEYIVLMRNYNVNGGEKLAKWILFDNNYGEFLETLERKL